MAICANCGAELPPRFNFCGVCGAPVPAAVEHEVRKVVSVLFCDITDSTGLGEREDPERLRTVLGRYFEEIERVIVGHGGLVEKFIGDAVMAVFGLPSAHEDDALRAVRAAAEVHELPATLAEETGLELAFRTGINTGEVVAGSGHTLVTGDAVNVAARLEQSAGPGEILLGAETVRLLGPLVEVELLPPLEVQGKALPVTAFRLGRLASGEERQRSPFVGRGRELTLLADAFGRSVEDRELHLFTVLGPAGIGKSRLVAEFLDSLGEEARIARGRCLSYGQGITFWPLVEVLRGLGEPAAPALERVLAGGATSPQELAWTVQQALEQAAAERPLVVVLEDLHWAEPALLDLLDCVCELSRDAPILMLCAARPELLEQRPGWGGGKLNATSILLEPLSASECDLLLDGLEHPLSRAQRRHVLEIACGNPLFLEESSEFVAEGGGDGELPPRIQALLQARLDLLPERERHVLACAAVEGTVVHLGGLERIVAADVACELRAHLAALTRKWLIRPAGAELAGEEGFRFRHQLIRDVAYGELPKGERARLHEGFAGWLEEQSAVREELEELAAYHLEQAALCRRELRGSHPALEARAASALAAAAERARSRADLRAAASLWRRALALLAEADPRMSEVQLRLAVTLGELGEYEEEGRLLENAGQRTTDPVVAANVQLVRLEAGLIAASEEPAAVRRACAEVIPLFEERGDDPSLGRAWFTLALAESYDLHLEAATQAFANAAERYRLGNRGIEVFTRTLGIRAGFYRIPPATAARELEQLAAEFPGEPMIEVDLGFFRALAASEAGRAEEARTLAQAALDGMHRAGYTIWAAFYEAIFGWYEGLSGDVVEGERLALAGVAALREHGARSFLAWALYYLAEIRILQGRYSEAIGLATEAEQCGAKDRGTLIRSHIVRARAHTRLGAIEEARAAAVTAVAATDETDSILDQADAQEALAETLAAADELPAAFAAAEESARLYTTLERTLAARRARALAEEIERRLGATEAPTPVA